VNKNNTTQAAAVADAAPCRPGEQEAAVSGSYGGTPPKGDTDAAMQFLRSLGPKGRRDLLAICPETGAVEGATFTPALREQMRAWIEARQGKVGIYYSVNEGCTDKRHTKLAKSDIGGLRFAFIDVDPDKSKPFAEERIRLRALVETLASDSTCPPTWIIDSGGGFQLLWMLDKRIEATPDNVALIEGIGRTLAKRLGGDSAWNIDRVLRVPGTLNVPDAKKRAHGRGAALAKVVGGTERPVGLSSLERWAPPTPEGASSRSGKSDLKYPEIDMKRVQAANGYDTLPEELRTRFEAACAHDTELQALWAGTAAKGQNDISGSGFTFALARLLKLGWSKHGITFTPSEFGMLLWVWEHGQDRNKLDARSIARAWARMEGCASPEEAAEALKPRWPDEGMPLEKAERELNKAIRKFFTRDVPKGIEQRAKHKAAQEASDKRWEAQRKEASEHAKAEGRKLRRQARPRVPAPDYPQTGIRVTPGGGKTHATIEELVALANKGTRSGYAVPAHVKAAEIVQALNQRAGRVIAAVWLGESQPDPDAPGETVCRRPDAVKAIREAGGRRSDLCGSPEKGTCQFYKRCRYRQQEAQRPLVWVFPHALLDYPPPAAIRDVDVLIIDEGLQNNPRRHRLPITEILAPREHIPEVAKRAVDALLATEAGTPLRRETLNAGGITHAACESARKLEAGNYPEVKVVPGDSDKANIERARTAAKDHKRTARLQRLWRELAAFLGLERGYDDASTRLTITKDGQSVEIGTRHELNEEWLHRPVLYLDGTLDERLARAWLPRLKLTADIRVKLGDGVTVRQVANKPVGYRRLFTRSKGDDDKWHAEPGPLLRDIMRKVEASCAQYRHTGGAVSLIAPKTAAELMEKLWQEHGKPANLITLHPVDASKTLHFNALRGVNSLENVRLHIVVSRPEMRAAALEADGVIMLDRHPTRSLAKEAGYEPRRAALRMANGSVAQVTEYVHPDPAFQTLLEQRREAELLQAIHRARPIRRGTDRPLTIDIITSVPLDVSVHQAVTLDDWLRVSVEEMLVARGFLPDSWEDKHAVLRDVFPSADAVRKAAGRDGSFASAKPGQALYRESYIDDVQDSHNAAAGKNDVSAAGWPRFRYRKNGHRRSHVVAIDPQLHPDPAAAWGARLEIAPSDLALWEAVAPCRTDAAAAAAAPLTYSRCKRQAAGAASLPRRMPKCSNRLTVNPGVVFAVVIRSSRGAVCPRAQRPGAPWLLPTRSRARCVAEALAALW
jgi:hypothetical protein